MSATGTFAHENIGMRERIAYATGDLGSNLFLCVGTLYLLKFYTDVMDIPAVYGGVIFLISKFFTAFTDLLTGILLDSRRNIGPRGKFRPFIFYGSFACLVVTILQFVPLNSLGLTMRVLVATVVFMGFGLCYSLMNCSYGAIIPAITRDPNERARLAAFRQGGSTTGLLICTVGFIPLAHLLDGAGVYSYTIAAACFACGGLVCMIFCYANLKERYTVIETNAERPSMFKSLGSIFSNRPLLVLATVNLCTLGAFNIKLAMQIYYCQYVLHDAILLSYMGFFSMGCVLIGVFLVPVLTPRLGKKRVYILGLGLWVLGDALNFFFNANSLTFVLFSCLAFLGTAFSNSLNWALVPDTVDYGEWKTGIRAEGSVYTGYTFSRKISAALAGFLPGILLSYIGYVPNAEQTADTMFGLHCLIFLIPGTLALVALVTMLFFYHLDEKLYVSIIKDLIRMRAEKAHQADPNFNVYELYPELKDLENKSTVNGTATRSSNK